jgi:hypothetical protein
LSNGRINYRNILYRITYCNNDIREPYSSLLHFFTVSRNPKVTINTLGVVLTSDGNRVIVATALWRGDCRALRSSRAGQLQSFIHATVSLHLDSPIGWLLFAIYWSLFVVQEISARTDLSGHSVAATTQ